MNRIDGRVTGLENNFSRMKATQNTKSNYEHVWIKEAIETAMDVRVLLHIEMRASGKPNKEIEERIYNCFLKYGNSGKSAPEEEKPKPEATKRPDITGEYIVDGYKNNKNDWHFVTVTKTSSGYVWKNKANRSWTLKWKAGSSKELDVGKECPYYNRGYKVANIRQDSSGNVTGIQGPGGEWYLKGSW